jgi:syntaxin-binding protein 5
MFSKHHERSFADLSINLREESEWLVGGLRSFEYLLDVVSLAIEPLAGLLACGMNVPHFPDCRRS